MHIFRTCFSFFNGRYGAATKFSSEFQVLNNVIIPITMEKGSYIPFFADDLIVCTWKVLHEFLTPRT